MLSRIIVLVAVVALGGCANRPDLPNGSLAYKVIPVAPAAGEARSYRIGPLDTIAITVFQEPDLSVKGLQVDAAGKVIVPLIGEVQAGGRTSTELAQYLAGQLRNRYLENPQVSVVVQDSVSQKVTVEGAVTEAGVYEIKGRTTLLDALAMAKGISRVAAYDEVAIFRTSGATRTGAVFDVGKIYRGEADDPEILGSDVVVVGRSRIKSAWLDLLTASPLIAAARP